EENYCIRGRSRGKVYTLGDRVKVEVVRADLQKKQLDYKFAEKTQEPGPAVQGEKKEDVRNRSHDARSRERKRPKKDDRRRK
ncbi:MAG TPA: hypothetical protein PLX08_14320, partial [Bacteroidales bacterium]|nr:hypothetical protein [Bacteroidales bacterium]